MRPIPSAPVFSRAEARAYGWSDAALSRAVRSGHVLRLRRDQFTTPQHKDDPRLAAAAAARACRGSVVSHRSAALVHGLPLLHVGPMRPDLTITPRATGDVCAALLHRATLRPSDVVEVDATAVTAVARTVVDLGRSSSTAAAVVAIDAALHRGLVDADALADVVWMCRTWPGIRRARRAISLADGRAESLLESISRLVLRWLRTPPPDLQSTLCDDRRQFLGRADFYWDEPGVVGEADGRSKYDSRPVLTAEKRRQEELEDAGLILVRWDWATATRRPQLLAARVNAAFARGRRRDSSGFPRLWSVRSA